MKLILGIMMYGALLFGIGAAAGSAFLFVFGFCLMIGPWAVAQATQCNTKTGRRQYRRTKQRQQEIEREYGIIDYEDR